MQPSQHDLAPEPQNDGSNQTPITIWQVWVIGIIAVSFLFLPFILGYYTDLFSLKLGGIGWESFFYILALLPGVLGIMHHIVSAPLRRIKAQGQIKRYLALQANTGTGDGSAPDDSTASAISACASSLLLTGVFLVVAVVIDTRLAAVRHEREHPKTLQSQARHNAEQNRTATKLTPVAVAPQGTTPVSTTKMNQAPAAQQPSASQEAALPTPALPIPSTDPSLGLILAGLGAYVAVLFYMAGRLYANALSSRFLATSALRSASAIALGYVLGLAGVATILPTPNTTIAAYFLVGLFHNWAINAMRTKALALLGAPKNDNDELPITIIEGIEDTSADLLSEYGVTTIQHLALTDAGDLSERTLIPLDRVCDWTDQAILIQRIKRSVASTRSLCIRSASDFARQYLRKQSGDDVATKLLASISEKTGLGAPAVDMIGREFATDARVCLIFKTLRGIDLAPLPDATQLDTEIDRSLKRYDVAGLNDTVPVGRLLIRPPAEQNQ